MSHLFTQLSFFFTSKVETLTLEIISISFCLKYSMPTNRTFLSFYHNLKINC